MLGDICPPHTTFLSVDLPGGGFLGGGYSCRRITTSSNRSSEQGRFFTACEWIHHAPETRAEAGAATQPSRKIDFLFIDGDHTYEGIRADFENYSTLVRPGGLIAFHDIVIHVANPSCRVHEFWNEVKSRPGAVELIDRDGFEIWGGIGVLVQY